MSVHIRELESLIGQRVGESQPMVVTQEMVDGFADATYDHQWIHVDPERARKGPFGEAIAHGFLTLSLIPYLAGQTLEVDGVGMGVNYGLNKVRFPSPVPVGRKVVAEVTVQDVTELDEGAKQVVSAVVITVEGASKPSCVAETVTRYYPSPEE